VPAGERHTLGLIGFGIALRNRGWRTIYLGPDTPIPDVRRIADQTSPAVVVLSAVMPARFADVEDELRDLAANVRLAVAGAGASRVLAERVGARLLEGDPVTAAESISREVVRRPG
jgi:MerR family transcriptional regulator, light-induced transcriptional regulator